MHHQEHGSSFAVISRTDCPSALVVRRYCEVLSYRQSQRMLAQHAMIHGTKDDDVCKEVLKNSGVRFDRFDRTLWSLMYVRTVQYVQLHDIMQLQAVVSST